MTSTSSAIVCHVLQFALSLNIDIAEEEVSPRLTRAEFSAVQLPSRRL